MMEYTDLTSSLQAAATKAENIAIEQIQSQRDFEPFILSGDSLDVMQRIKTRDMDEILDIAEELLSASDDSETAVLAYKDSITLNDGTFDAIVCQIYNVEEDNGYSFGLLYQIVNDNIRFLNKHVFLGKVRNLLIF
ncbi:hypothetical protein HF324_07145 [Chitinophaga oryzae]|uniref:Uncharacterized protein n=1 Tax=Chitinophaga oryzae TaxID=2725414 RepID=A0AAE6ZFP4_9BACT|nr:hypothetical protein [Chitinophaga oryzae]QJB31151.1 hypothetical protein HF329_07485 [Chitinophaga oryzae]QJB37637.1 hypothetical protein HF324_07145 [Chitinophaga oryzae]